MDESNAVRVVQATPEFYDSVSMTGADPFMLGRQGRITKYIMNDKFEPMWEVKMVPDGKLQHFYEEELEVIDDIEGPPQDTTPDKPKPAWYDKVDDLQQMLSLVRMGLAELDHTFEGWFTDEEAVERHISRLTRGEE